MSTQPSLGLFFDNYEHFLSLYPLMASHFREYRQQFTKVYELLKDKSRVCFYTGSGRMELVGQRGVENFREGLGIEAYHAKDGTSPGGSENDVLIAISSTGEKKPTLVDVEEAKSDKLKMCVIGLTSDDSSTLAKKSDILIKIPGRGRGEEQIKGYLTRLGGIHLPLQVMGSIPEFCAMVKIDCMSYALAKATDEKSFCNAFERALFEYSSYSGDIHEYLEKDRQQHILEKMINDISFNVRNLLVTAFKFSTYTGEMFATRTNHSIYKRGERRADIIDSRNVPIKGKINKDDGLVAISGSGDSWFTLKVAEMFKEAGCKVFGVSMKEKSELSELVGEENMLLFPECERYPLKNGYELRPFDVCALAPLDCIAMEVMYNLGKDEEKSKKSHSDFT